MRAGLTVVGVIVVGVTAISPPLFAKAPADIAKLVGVGANGAESAMEVLGYEPTGKGDGIFRNFTTGTCVQVHITIDDTGGKVSSIDTVDRAVCER